MRKFCLTVNSHYAIFFLNFISKSLHEELKAIFKLYKKVNITLEITNNSITKREEKIHL